VDNAKYIDDYRKAGINAFLFALKGYSVGYNTYSLEEIEKIDVSNKYILINRLLDSFEVDSLKDVLKNIKGIKGIVYEDIAIYMIAKELNLDVELIFFQNHFGTSLPEVNFWLDRVDSMFISNEITKEEIEFILDGVKKEVCIHLYGYNQVMYSRRLLLSNWSEEFDIPYKNSNVIVDKATKVKFRALENEYGTVMYSENIFNGSELLDCNNIKYFYVNPTMINHDIVMDFLSNKAHKSDLEDKGFLYKETIYKLKERAK
jgi:collagenase-like PrtC family protease